MIALVVVLLIGVAGFQAYLALRIDALEERTKRLEADSHPPVDVRPAMRMVARAEVKRFLEEQVP